MWLTPVAPPPLRRTGPSALPHSRAPLARTRATNPSRPKGNLSHTQTDVPCVRSMPTPKKKTLFLPLASVCPSRSPRRTLPRTLARSAPPSTPPPFFFCFSSPFLAERHRDARPADPHRDPFSRNHTNKATKPWPPGSSPRPNAARTQGPRGARTPLTPRRKDTRRRRTKGSPKNQRLGEPSRWTPEK